MESVRDGPDDGENTFVEIDGQSFPHRFNHYDRYGKEQYETRNRKEYLLRIPTDLHGAISRYAIKRNKSVNRSICEAIARYINN